MYEALFSPMVSRAFSSMARFHSLGIPKRYTAPAVIARRPTTIARRVVPEDMFVCLDPMIDQCSLMFNGLKSFSSFSLFFFLLAVPRLLLKSFTLTAKVRFSFGRVMGCSRG